MRLLRISGRVLLAGIIPTAVSPNPQDVISKDTPTYKSFLERKPSSETGWARLKEMFQLDEMESISPELNSIYQAGFTGFLLGGLYGGFIYSRESYLNFMENNQATAFKSHLDAKRKLQDNFTVSFAKGSLKWGWRIGIFTTSYVGIITCISVYREKSSIFEYLAAGTITGAMYRLNMGLRGITAGAVVGGCLGGIAGAASLLLLKLSGSSMEEMRYWQHKWRLERDRQVQEAFRTQAERDTPTLELLKQHDKVVGDKVKLEKID